MNEKSASDKRWDRATAIANILIAIAAIATFWITWSALNGQSKTEESILNKFTALASSSAAQATSLNQQANLIQNEDALLSSQVNLTSLEERPYLEVDASNMAQQLGNVETDPNDAFNTPDETAYTNGVPDMTKIEALMQARSQPEPFNVAFSFTIQNTGHLPARYAVDTTQFQFPGLVRLIPPANQSGVIFPNQTITVGYGIQGDKNTPAYYQELEESSNAMASLINPSSTFMMDSFLTAFGLSTNTKPYSSAISIKYGLLNGGPLNFGTAIKQEVYEENCSNIPTPTIRCDNPEWVVEQAE